MTTRIVFNFFFRIVIFHNKIEVGLIPQSQLPYRLCFIRNYAYGLPEPKTKILRIWIYIKERWDLTGDPFGISLGTGLS